MRSCHTSIVGVLVAISLVVALGGRDECGGTHVLMHEREEKTADEEAAPISVDCHTDVHGELVKVTTEKQHTYSQDKFGGRLGSGEFGDVYALDSGKVLKVPKRQDDGASAGCDTEGNAKDHEEEIKYADCLKDFLDELNGPVDLNVRTTAVEKGTGTLESQKKVSVLVKTRVFGQDYSSLADPKEEANHTLHRFFVGMKEKTNEGSMTKSITDLKLANIMWGYTEEDQTKRLYLVDVTCFELPEGGGPEQANTYMRNWYVMAKKWYQWSRVYGRMDPNDTPPRDTNQEHREQQERQRQIGVEKKGKWNRICDNRNSANDDDQFCQSETTIETVKNILGSEQNLQITRVYRGIYDRKKCHHMVVNEICTWAATGTANIGQCAFCELILPHLE